MSYLTVVFVSLILGLGAQFWIDHTFKRWSKVSVSGGETGARAARRLLDEANLRSVQIYPNHGADLSDYYDPRTDALYLSQTSEHGGSVASIAVACHEAGHAVQHAQGYLPARIRMAIVPVVNFGSQAWMIILILGIIINVSSLVTIGIVLFSLTLVFQLVTLPVEFDASARAMRFIETDPYFSSDQVKGARMMLTAAAFTYIAATLTSILQLLHLLTIAREQD